MLQFICNLPEYSTSRLTLSLLLVVVPCFGLRNHVGPYQVWRPMMETTHSYKGWQPKIERMDAYEGWQPKIEWMDTYEGWQHRMGRSDDSYEDSYEDSFWDDYSTESEGSGESNLEDEGSSHEKEPQKTPEEDSSIEIEEDYSSYESDTDFWEDYSNESEEDETEEDSLESTSEEEESSENEGAELQDAIDETYSLKEHNNAYYYPQNTDLVTRIGEVDNLARTYSSSVDLAEVYTSLTDTSTVVRKILQTTITWTSKNIGWIVVSAAWSSLRGFMGGRALPKDTSRSIQLATAPNEALQEIFTIIGSGLFTILIWLVSTSYQSSAAETTDHEARQGRSQNLWWLSPEFASSENQIYQRNAFTGGSGLVTILDDMFGTEGTMDFLKDNFFESSGALLFWSLMGLLP